MQGRSTGNQATPVALAAAGDASTFGGKAAQLAAATRAGLRVPDGVALAWWLVDAIGGGHPDAIAGLDAAVSPLGASLAVRSSAIGEDSDAASFAGQHLTVLGVPSSAPADAVQAVLRSARSEGAIAYRQRLGLSRRARVGIVIQEMLDADAAGVLFHPNPVTGAEEIVIEAAWGLGEAVVGGLITPDLFRLSLGAEVLERRPGVKDLQVRPVAGGGTAARPVAADRVHSLCLDDGQLGELHRMAMMCRKVFEGSQDLEWAFARGAAWLLQRRAITKRCDPGVAPLDTSRLDER